MNLPFLQVEDFEMEGYSASGLPHHRRRKCPGGWYDRFRRLSEVPDTEMNISKGFAFNM